MGDVPSAEERRLQRVQQRAFDYFLHETNPANGLVVDKTAEGWPASIAATGLALSCYPVAVERGFVSRGEGTEDIFVHMETLRRFGLMELRPGQTVLVRFGPGDKGLMAAEIRPDGAMGGPASSH